MTWQVFDFYSKPTILETWDFSIECYALRIRFFFVFFFFVFFIFYFLSSVLRMCWKHNKGRVVEIDV